VGKGDAKLDLDEDSEAKAHFTPDVGRQKPPLAKIGDIRAQGPPSSYRELSGCGLTETGIAIPLRQVPCGMEPVEVWAAAGDVEPPPGCPDTGAFSIAETERSTLSL